MCKLLWFNNDLGIHINKLVLSHLEIHDFINLTMINKQYYDYYCADYLWVYNFGYPKAETIHHYNQLNRYMPLKFIKFYGNKNSSDTFVSEESYFICII